MKKQKLLLCLLLSVPLCNIALAIDPASVPGPRTEVKMLMGRPIFFCDGKPVARPLFATYVPDKKYYEQMAKAAGCTLFNFQTNCASSDGAFSKDVWVEPDKWDFSEMDERAHAILSADPNALIFPRIFIGVPKWWYEKYPEEMIVLDNGKTLYDQPCNPFANVWLRPYPSLASRKWKEDMTFALRKTLEHIRTSDWGKNIFGYELASLGSEEWYFMNVNQEQLADYSVHMKNAFVKWLTDKYKTEENLEKAWNNPHITFADVNIPSRQERQIDRANTFRDPATKMNVIDFYLFYNTVIPDTINYFAGVVKEATGGKKVVGPFYHYLFEFRGNPEFGHNGGYRILTKCPNVDFVLNSPNYHNRSIGSGANYYRHPMLSATLNSKLWVYDNDGVSYLYPKVAGNWDKKMYDQFKIWLAVPDTAQQTIWYYQREAGFVLCEGIYETYFDMHGGYYDNPRMLNTLAEIGQMFQHSVNYDRTSVAEVLIVADEASQSYQTFESDWAPPGQTVQKRISESLLEFQTAFIRSGAPIDSIYLDDIGKVNMDRYKVIMFLNTWHMDDEQRKIINEKVKVPGRTIIWCYAPGYFNKNQASADFMSTLTGINIIPSDDETLIVPQVKLNQLGREFVSKYGEQPQQQPMGLKIKVCKLFSVKDINARPMGTLPDANAVTMAMKDINGVISIYTITPVMNREMVRAIEKSAGVHLYNDCNDAIWVNKNYITINGATAGTKIIKLPHQSDVYNALTEQKLYTNVKEFEISLMVGETQLFRY